ncbi:DUF2851 family protein [Croceiramulus getboli]|nr:DUF2851 family protein [Flavobacteriaceae bacterium YJPT1-3]
MREDFLHYLWLYKKLAVPSSGPPDRTITLTDGQAFELLDSGQHNQLAGPDFFNAQVRIDGQHWVGNVEVHLKASDWYAHHHETDEAYANVILHVVWEHDVDVYDLNNNPLPTLQLKDWVLPSVLANYQSLFRNKKYKFILCEQEIDQVDPGLVEAWLESLYLERLEQKVMRIEQLLAESKNDWEAVLFSMLLRSFGTQINAEAFEQLAKSIPFPIIRKLAQDQSTLEIVLLGRAGLLDPPLNHPFQEQWLRQFKYLEHKFSLAPAQLPVVQFYRLRPPNFPTVRLSQFAAVYAQSQSLFNTLMQADTLEAMLPLFQTTPSAFWQKHYTFTKAHPRKEKKLSRSFIDLLLINTVLPLHFAYHRKRRLNQDSEVLSWMAKLPAESNRVVREFAKRIPATQNALHTQALVQLKLHYCDRFRCLHCRVGNSLLQRPIQP